MVRIWPTIRLTLRASFLPLVVPVGTLVILLLLFGLKIEVVLGFIVLLQLYLAWLQTDVMRAQTSLAEIEYQPLFVISLESSSALHPSPCFAMRNSGKYPAFNLMIGLVEVLQDQRKRVADNLQLNKHGPELLAPNNSIVFLLAETQVIDKRIEMNVFYNDALGEMREATFVKFEKTDQFWLLRAPIRIHRGLLTESIEHLHLLRSLVRLSQTSHESGKKKMVVSKDT
jgi:hypothetical protein